MRIGSVCITPGFLLLMAWLNYSDGQGLFFPAIAACALHELGHLWTIRKLGGKVRLFSLTAVGAEIQMARPMSYLGELLSALAGPGVNLALAWVCCRLEGGMLFAGLNLALGCFNLLPLGRLDGGRALNCILSWAFGPSTCAHVMALINSLVTRALLVLGLLFLWQGRNFTLLLVAVWLMAVEKEGEKAGNRACQGRKKQVKWFLHSARRGVLEERNEPDTGAHPAQGTKARPLYGRRI